MAFLDFPGLSHYLDKLKTIFVSSNKVGSANGIASLDSSGRVPSSQLPSYVDDVVTYNSLSDFPVTGEDGKIYIAKDTNITYRWGGSSYVAIGSDLALGETSSTAYRGDRGKTAYDHATAKGSEFSSGMYKITTNAQGHVTAATAVEKSDITGLGIPAQDTTYESKTAASGGTAVSLVTTGEKYTWNNKASTSAATTSTAGLMSAADKTKLNGIATGATANIGTITGITMNGASKGTSGVVDLGTVITAHQDISGKVSGPSSATNNAVAIFDGTGGKTIKNSGFTIGKSVPSDAKFTDTTYSVMTGATSSAAGAAGLAPAPSAGDQLKVLYGDGTWGTVEALPSVSSSDNGKFLMVVNGEWAVGSIQAAAGVSF